jgi:hypothetical protein
VRGIFLDSHLWRRQSFAVGRALKTHTHTHILAYYFWISDEVKAKLSRYMPWWHMGGEEV